MHTFETLVLGRERGVATVMLNRPAARNALSAQMARELCEALATLRQDPRVRVIVLHGAGGAFCAGGDMGATHRAGRRSADTIEAGYDCFRQLTQALHDMDRPVIAAADGVAYGAGFSLLLLCDIVLLGSEARLCMAFQRMGLVPDCGAMYTLPRWVGLQRAKELMFSARELRAEEACALGIALEVLPPEALLPRALAMAHAFGEGSEAALRMTKRGLNASFDCTLSSMLALESTSQGIALASDYVAQSAQRFAAREQPRFQWPAAASAAASAPTGKK